MTAWDIKCLQNNMSRRKVAPEMFIECVLYIQHNAQESIINRFMRDVAIAVLSRQSPSHYNPQNFS